MNSRRAASIAVAAFWTLFGVLTGFQVWVSMITHGHSVPRLVGYYVLLWEPWLAFTAIIVWIGRRWPLIPLRRRYLLIHLLAAFLIGLVHSVYYVALTGLMRPFDRMTPAFPGPAALGFVVSQLPIEFIVYGGVIALQHVANHSRRHRELERSLIQAQLQALELQIKPHFLFNTLNAVSSLVRTGKPNEAIVMIAGLSDLLRYSLDHAGNRSVTLDEEGAMVRCYMEIQRVRFPDRLTFGIEIPPEVRRAAVPTLILQPLAENAIRHGIARCAGPGTVSLRAFRDDSDLRIEIFNTGKLGGGQEGIGLRNTRERLSQIYGDAHRFEIRDRGDGVLASLSIPCREIA
jgi:two-component system, LytTR family, sensor kinase